VATTDEPIWRRQAFEQQQTMPRACKGGPTQKLWFLFPRICSRFLKIISFLPYYRAVAPLFHCFHHHRLLYIRAMLMIFFVS
jgi:hypothetical protein